MSKDKQISKWGNSAGIRLPKEVLSQASLEVDDKVKMRVIDLEDGSRGILITSLDANDNVSGISQERVERLLQQLEKVDFSRFSHPEQTQE